MEIKYMEIKTHKTETETKMQRKEMKKIQIYRM